MIWTNVLQRCTVLVPTMDSTKLLMIWGQGIMSYSVNGIPCVDCKFSTRLNDCGWLEWIVGLMVHFLICDDIYIGKFDRVFFYEVARLWRWCFSYMIIQFMAVGLPWIVDQYKWSARPSQYRPINLLMINHFSSFKNPIPIIFSRKLLCRLHIFCKSGYWCNWGCQGSIFCRRSLVLIVPMQRHI